VRKFRVDFSAIRVPPEALELIGNCLAQEAVGQSGYIVEFERLVAEYVGAEYCVAVANGTLADAVACAAMRERYGVTRAVVPALTFVAQPNAVRMAGLGVEFVDVKEDWTLDQGKVSPYQPAFLFPAHLLGRMAAVEDLPAGARLVEDACEAFGTRLHGRAAGTFGRLGTFSFFVSHTVTTGEGGAIVTDDPDLAQMCRQLRSHGRASEMDAHRKFSFPYLGFNAKMSGLTAAFGVAVMRHVREYIAARRVNFSLLNDLLGGRFRERPGESVIAHAYPVGFQSEGARNLAMDHLLSAGVEVRRFFSSVPTEPAWRKSARRFPCAEHISRTHLLVPCHHNLSPDDVGWLAERVLEQEGLCSPSSLPAPSLALA